MSEKLGPGAIVLGGPDAWLVGRVLAEWRQSRKSSGGTLNADLARVFALFEAASGDLAQSLTHVGSRKSADPDDSAQCSADDLTCMEVADMLGTTDRNVRDLCARESLPACKFGSQWRIRRDAVTDLLLHRNL